MWGNKELTRLDKIYLFLKTNNYRDIDSVTNYLELRKKTIPFCDDETLAELLDIIYKNNKKFDTIEEAKELYNLVVYDESNIEQKSLFLKIFTFYINNKYIKFKDLKRIYYIFDNKKYILGILDEIEDITKLDNDILEKIINYIVNARQYYVDDTAFFSSCIKTIDEINDVKHNIDEVKKILLKELEEAKKIAGVYNIDEEKLESLPIQLEELSKKQSEVNEGIDKSRMEQIELEEKLKILSNQLLYEISEKKNEFRKDILIDLKGTVDILRDIMNDYKSFNSKDINPVIDQLMTKIDYLTNKINNNNIKIDNNDNNDIKDNLKIDEILEQIKIQLKQDGIYNNELEINNVDNEFKEFINKTYEDLDEVEYEIKKELIDSIKEISLVSSKNYIVLNNYEDQMEKDLRTLADRYDYLKTFYYALYNDNLEVFKSCPEEDLIFYDKRNTDLFDKKIYIDILSNLPYILDAYIKANELPLLASFFNIDPSFDIKNSLIGSDVDRLKEIVSVFGIDTVLNLTSENNPNLYQTLISIDLDHMNILKEVLNLNPSFETYFCMDACDYSIFDEDLIINDYTLDDIASLTLEQQKVILNSNDINDSNTYMKLFLSNTEALVNENTVKFLNNNMFDFSLEEYIELDYEKSREIIKLYREYLEAFDMENFRFCAPQTDRCRKLLNKKIREIRKTNKQKEKSIKKKRRFDYNEF